MSSIARVGFSHHRNPLQAGKEASLEALSELEGLPVSMVFVFASVGYDQDILLSAIREETGDVPLCGCSGEGVIAKGEADETPFSVGIMVISSTTLTFDTFCFANTLNNDMENAGKIISKQINSLLPKQPIGLFIFPDALSFNFDRFISGLEKELDGPETLPIFGGLAGDDWRFLKTYQYYNGQVISDGITAVLISGTAELFYEVNHGCIPIGQQRTVTKSVGNKIYEIDDKPILDVLKEYLSPEDIDNWDEAVISLCLGLECPDYMGDDYGYLIRTIQKKNEKEGYVLINTEKEVYEGAKVWMTIRDPKLVVEGIDSMIDSMNLKLQGRSPSFMLHFDCSGRGKLLFREEQKQELTAKMQNAFGDDIPWLGLYAFGEICPVNNQNSFHNYTAVLTAFIG